MVNGLSILDSPEATYSLRVSVIENCQYQCPYCLPGTIKPFAHKPNWLTIPEYQVIADTLASLPITKIRFTGGEPLLRSNLTEIVGVFAEAFPKAALSITTNGEHLHKKIDGLVAAGLSRVNVHIDSLDPVKYKKVMGNGNLNEIIQFLGELKSRVDELKINVVLQKGVNDNELLDFIRFSAATGIEVRFIELMDTGSAKQYVGDTFLKGADAIAILEEHFEVRQIERRHLSDPASLFEIADEGVQFGLIASDTQPFCENCNRLRLNAAGELRGCLYQPEGIALGAMIRKGVSQNELINEINAAIKNKRSYHPLAAGPKYKFSMSEIGG